MQDFSLLSLRVAVFLCIFLKNDFLFIMFDPPAVRDFIVRVLDWEVTKTNETDGSDQSC